VTAIAESQDRSHRAGGQVFEIDLRRSFVVGDMCSDMELAHRAGIKGILVKTGYGLGEIEYILPQKTTKPAHIAEDLLDAVRWILDAEMEINPYAKPLN